ncbi:hypothetical protein RHMOL_Rhmol06G0117300 [Rhododendron molle]|uniref:Uncharacterized protein n=1 Tax=Rhododendron molle TaxID=49168 RepID=A0ACC0NCN4_RHOML|nr:hypothetical protein RHMOL_Rhmol06G0117300 [Rhododendron molle]
MYMNLNRQNSKTASTQQSRSSNRSVQQSRSSNITGQQTQQLKKLWMEKNLKRWMISLNVILTQTTKTLNHMNTKTEIATAGTIDSESLVDNEKLGHTFPEPGCNGSGGTEDLDLARKDGSNEPSISSTTATSQETLADEESEKAVDTKQHHFMSDEPTAEPESIPEEGNGFQVEAHTMDKEPVVSVMLMRRSLTKTRFGQQLLSKKKVHRKMKSLMFCLISWIQKRRYHVKRSQ